MKPDNHGKRDLIIEQWWVGLGAMLFWSVFIMLVTKCCS